MRNFMKGESGSFAVPAAVTLGALLMGVGAAIDFNNANRSQAHLQAAIDAGVLAAVMDESMKGVKAGKSKDAQAIVEDVARQNLPEGFRFDVDVEVRDKMLYAEARHSHSTALLQLFGRDTLSVSIDSAAVVPEDIPLHLSLVIDTTDSMTGANMTALKAAGNALLDDIDDFSDNAMVSLVPYGQYVNIGPQRENVPWLDTSRRKETKTSRRAPGCRTEREVLTPRSCRPTGQTRQEPIRRDGALVGYRTINEQTCTDAIYGTSREVCWDESTSTRTINFDFKGCVASRPYPDNLIPQASRTNQIRAAMEPDNATWKAECGDQLVPLTDNISTVRARLNALTTSSDTYMPAGLMWGWRTLDPRVPFTQARGAKPNTVRAIVLMTDGGNTINQNGEGSEDPGYHYDKGSWGDSGRDLLDEMCTRVKDDGILVFTIGYNLDPTFPRFSESVASLQNCASSRGHAFRPDNVTELKDAFESVMLSIRDIRLAI